MTDVLALCYRDGLMHKIVLNVKYNKDHLEVDNFAQIEFSIEAIRLYINKNHTQGYSLYLRYTSLAEYRSIIESGKEIYFKTVEEFTTNNPTLLGVY